MVSPTTDSYRREILTVSLVDIYAKKKLPTTTETKYSRMDQAKFVEDNFKHILSS